MWHKISPQTATYTAKWTNSSISAAAHTRDLWSQSWLQIKYDIWTKYFTFILENSDRRENVIHHLLNFNFRFSNSIYNRYNLLDVWCRILFCWRPFGFKTKTNECSLSWKNFPTLILMYYCVLHCCSVRKVSIHNLYSFHSFQL